MWTINNFLGQEEENKKNKEDNSLLSPDKLSKELLENSKNDNDPAIFDKKDGKILTNDGRELLNEQ